MLLYVLGKYCIYSVEKSLLGDVRIDLLHPEATHKIDLSEGKLPFQDLEFDTTIADPPWFGPQNWDKWEQLMREITRVTKKRIIFILGPLIYILPKPFQLKKIYIVKKVSPQIKLVYLWEREDDILRLYHLNHKAYQLTS